MSRSRRHSPRASATIRAALWTLAIGVATLGGSAPLAAKGSDQGKVDPVELQFDTMYASDDAQARGKAIEALRDAPDALKLSILSKKVVGKETRADVVSRAVEVLEKIRDEAVVAQMATLAKTPATPERVVYVEAMASMLGSTVAHDVLHTLVKDKDVWVRAMAASALAAHRSMDALAPLLALLDDRNWVVQVAALSGLPRLTDKEELRKKAVPELVEFLENCSGRLRVDCADALRRITGKNFGTEPSAWRTWYDSGMPDAPRPKPAEDAPAPTKGGTQDVEKPHFYGVEVQTNRAVIILDLSLSMYDAIEIDRERLKRETSRRRVVTGESNDPKDAKEEDRGFDIPWWKVKTKLDLAKYQTINLVSMLREDQSFELITFSKEAAFWMGKLVPATAMNKQKAIAMLELVTPQESTNYWAAFSMAFDMVDVNKKGESLGPDEIYLVTDGGLGSAGDIQDHAQILDAVLQITKVKPVKINVIQIGCDLSFLRKMAMTTGGVNKSLKDDSK